MTPIARQTAREWAKRHLEHGFYTRASFSGAEMGAETEYLRARRYSPSGRLLPRSVYPTDCLNGDVYRRSDRVAPHIAPIRWIADIREGQGEQYLEAIKA